jgi:hypothetical protein
MSTFSHRGRWPGMVRIACGRFNRSGQYRKTTLLERYGPRIVGPDLLSRSQIVIAKIP